jgi:hypothetical protein
MLLAILLAALAIAVLASDHSGRRDSRDDRRLSDLSSDDRIIIEEDSDFTARVQAALQRDAPVVANIFSSSSSGDLSEVREENRAAAIAQRLEEVQEERAYRKSNVFSYQAVFSRNVTQDCTANSGTITFANNSGKANALLLCVTTITNYIPALLHSATEPFDQVGQIRRLCVYSPRGC